MASFGKVLDLLDDRYLNLQDVVGNVEPLPTLVPYDNYKQNVLVYRMDTNHELFMGLIQDFTARMSQQLGKELWTWCVQWEVDTHDVFAHSSKKPRLDAEHSRAEAAGEQTPRRAPIIDVFNRQVLDPELTKEEDMLRILIDIVQVDSTIVPNFIEFLYRWIDYYEGDGKALKAALKWEIPSLWDFEYHPLILPAEIKKKVEQQKAEQLKRSVPAPFNEQGGQDSTLTRSPSAQDLIAQGSSTKKMREKPDVAAMERQIEQSERLQYREVKYGIQPPKLNQPISPLINIPRDPTKRVRYYAACFKSRQRALVLLLEAGVSMQQISNYQKLQEAHPRDTPEDGDPKELKGLRHYHKDAGAAQDYYKLREKLQLHREKQKEIAISNRLATEAQFATPGAASDNSAGMPLIARTPSHAHHPDMAADMLTRIRAARGMREETINLVPTQLVGRMKSRLMGSAKDRRSMQGARKSGSHLLPNAQRHRSVQHEEDDTEGDAGIDSDTEGSSDGDDDARESRRSLQTQPPPLHPDPHSGKLLSVQQQGSFYVLGSRAIGAIPALSAPTPAFMAEYMRNLTPEQAERLVPLLTQTTRQAVASSLGLQTSSSHNTSTGILRQGLQAIPPPNMHQPENTVALPSTDIITGVDQARSAPLPLPPSAHSPTYTEPSALGSNGLHLDQRQMNFQAGSRAFASLGSQPSLQPFFLSSQGAQPASNDQGNFSQPPQVLRPPQTIPPTSLISQLLRSPTLSVPPPDAPRHTALQGRLAPQRNAHGTPATAPHVQQSTCADSTLPIPALSNILSMEHLQALRRQRDVQAQVPLQPPSFGQATSQYPVQQPARHPSAQGDNLQSPLQQLSRLAALQCSFRPTPPSTMVIGPQHQLLQPISSFPPIPTSIQRNAPTPLTIPSSANPFSSLAPHLLATTPFAASPHVMPIQIYFPRVVVPGNGIGPNGMRLGDNDAIETDAFLIGYADPGSGKIVLSKALFMPVGVWTNSLNRVRKGAYEVLETYLVNGKEGAHRTVYTKLVQAYSIIRSATHREHDLTKRWRASKGPMTQQDRGAVWEGWGAVLDRGIEMGKEEREGAFVRSWLIDEGVERKRDEEKDRRWREIEELLEEEDWDEDEDVKT